MSGDMEGYPHPRYYLSFLKGVIKINTEEEIWKALYYGNIRTDLYQISNMGRVRNKITGKLLTPCPSEKGYMMYCLRLNNNKSKSIKIHRIVARLFVPGETIEKCEVDHIDCDKSNNAASNLRWVSHYENIHYAYKNNLIPPMRGENNGSCKVSEKQVIEICELLVAFGGNASEVYHYLKNKGYNYRIGYILDIKRKRMWAHLSDKYFKLKDFDK